MANPSATSKGQDEADVPQQPAGCSVFSKSCDLPVSKIDAFAYHERPGALQRLIPPFDPSVVESHSGTITDGSRAVVAVRLPVLPIRIRLIAEHTGYQPPDKFEDFQRQGPFAFWHHVHRFESAMGSNDPQRSSLADEITYKLPLGAFGAFLGSSLVRRQLDQMFSYRHHTTMHDLSLADEYQLSPQRIAISGGSGLVGSNFTALATLLGHSVVPIVRGDGRDENEIAIWADDGKSQAGKFADVDTVIHLAGKPIAEGRWTDAMKESIRDSRTVKTRQLCERLAALPDSQRPKTLICASASGYYGSRGDEQLSEDSPVGEGFLAEVCINWEKACQPAIQAGIRVVHARFGIILSPNSGALQKLLTPTKLGAGGPVGNGQHWWPWIGIDDALGGLYHLIAKPEIHGSVNFAAPESARQKEFAKVLGRVLNRPSFMPAPAFAMRLLLGEMADHLLLTSCRMQPQRLLDTGYQFRFPDLESCLRHLLGRRTLTQASGK